MRMRLLVGSCVTGLLLSAAGAGAAGPSEVADAVMRGDTATVRALSPATVYVFDDAERFLRSNPEIAFLLGRLLAERLNAATTYLVDIKRQFEGHSSHLGMVGDVLEVLIHQQPENFSFSPERDNDPRL